MIILSRQARDKHRDTSNREMRLLAGEPWGGLLTTARDMTAFYQAMLGGASQLTRARIILPGTAFAMCRSFTHGAQSTVPLAKQKMGGLIYGGSPSSSWGLGFRINEAELMFGVEPSKAFGTSCFVSRDLIVHTASALLPLSLMEELFLHYETAEFAKTG
jgi:CubicO group peptidase (beta-lactamase class C family)